LDRAGPRIGLDDVERRKKNSCPIFLYTWKYNFMQIKRERAVEWNSFKAY
jgi:hypothetical protein